MNKMAELPKVYLRDQDDMNDYFCDMMKCNQMNMGNESDPVGCHGCDASEEFGDLNYSDVMLDEQDKNKKYFVDTEELNNYLGSVMNVRNDEKSMRLMIIDLQRKLKEKSLWFKGNK